MKTEDYKKIFKRLPEKEWLSSSLHSILNGEEFPEILEYLIGTKNIDDINDIEKLNQIKVSFLKLSVIAKKIDDLIEKLDLAFIGEFDDSMISLYDININAYDLLECVNDFNYHEFITIYAGSTIEVKEINYAGKNNLFHCKFINHLTDDLTRENHPNSATINMLFSLNELKEKFNKIEFVHEKMQ